MTDIPNTEGQQPAFPGAGGSDSVEQIFEDVALMNTPPKEEDPYESEEYQRFVESMVPHCHCAERHRPCDGVLAGGLCDNMQDDPDRNDEEDDL